MIRPFQLLLHAVLLAGSIPAAAAQDILELRFLDVGQGDAALIRHSGSTILVDAGPTNDIAGRLFELGVRDVDLLVVSHPHADHLGGADAVLETFPVRYYMDNGVPHTTRSYERVMDLVERIPVRYLRADRRTIRIGDATLEIIPAPPALQGDPNLNNQSLAVVLRRGDFVALLTGDAETEAINGWLELDAVPSGVTVLKGGHHGSRNGVTPGLLSRTKPEVVVLSLGEGNSYGHPHEWAMRYYRAGGRRVLRTDESGDILFEVDPDGSYSIGTCR